MIDIAQIRQAIANLPRADNHRPGEPVEVAEVYMASSHRRALDLDRPVVFGNRGMGKSFWAHALLNPEIRTQLAREFRFPALDATQVVVGFNASERWDGIAPPPAILGEAGQERKAEESLWRAVLTRAAAQQLGESLPERFADLVAWVEADAERCARLLTRADDTLQAQGRKLLVLFDALDRLGSDWTAVRARTRGLLQLALATQSFRAIRVKLFLRRDQHFELRLYDFPDGSKLLNTAVELAWDPLDLYQLLFLRLRANPAFRELEAELGSRDPRPLVEALAGQHMGSLKRGYVFNWIPTHLADALRQISPRTFLTAWREAAAHGPCPQGTPVDHQGILEGVRRASEDRLAELSEDYPWVRALLEPLRGDMVPMEHDRLIELWRSSGAAASASQQSQEADKSVRVPRREQDDSLETLFLKALVFIGVLEVRRNGTIDVPDIFRVEAGIKRRGGVKPPVRTRSAR